MGGLIDLPFFFNNRMIKLSNTSNTQTISFIPREYTSGRTYTIKIRSKSENREIFSATTTSFGSQSYYQTYEDVFTGLAEDNFYTLTITSPTEVVFKDMIFCTDQFPNYEIWNQVERKFGTADWNWNSTPEDAEYSVNKGKYTSIQTDNEFIYYE